MFQTWLNVLTHPGEAIFAEEQQRPSATLGTAMLWMAIAGLVSGLVAIISGFIFRNSLQAAGGLQGILNQFLPDEIVSQIDPAALDQIVQPRTTWAIFSGGLWVIIGTVIGFLFGVGILFLIAKLFGGTGAYGRFAYLIAAFAAPLSILSSLLGFVPVVGGCAGIFIAIYDLILAYFAIKVEHSLSQGKAIAVLLIPLLLIVVLGGCAAVAFGSMIAGLMSGN